MWGIRTLLFSLKRKISVHMVMVGRSLVPRSARALSFRMERMLSLCVFSHRLRLRFGFSSGDAGLLGPRVLAPALLRLRLWLCVALIGSLLPLRRAVLSAPFGPVAMV